MQVDIGEALRYLGAGDGDEALRAQAQRIAASIQEIPRYVYRVCRLERTAEGFFLPEANLTLTGATAQTMLASCRLTAVLVCTLGLGFDARLRAMQARSMADAVILDACGSALVEQGCDAAEAELKARFPHLYLTDRFSPGYGGVPLTLQGPVCAALDVQRRLGVTVTPSLLLNPCKTVTAFIGLSETPQMARIRGCAFCSMKNTCKLRKGGKHCGL